jgi:surface antigen
VAGRVARQYRLYSGYVPARLWRGVSAAAVLTAALACGGCSLSYQLDSFFGGGKSETTGSIKPRPGTKQAHALPSDGDLVYARAAASEVLRRGKKDASLPWENPRSGARGTVTPIASAYTEGGHTCRNFLASYVNGDAETWLQGEACKQGRDGWQVRSLKPWKRS